MMRVALIFAVMWMAVVTAMMVRLVLVEERLTAVEVARQVLPK
jgi:hypothetical protein